MESKSIGSDNTRYLDIFCIAYRCVSPKAIVIRLGTVTIPKPKPTMLALVRLPNATLYCVMLHVLAKHSSTTNVKIS